MGMAATWQLSPYVFFFPGNFGACTMPRRLRPYYDNLAGVPWPLHALCVVTGVYLVFAVFIAFYEGVNAVSDYLTERNN